MTTKIPAELSSTPGISDSSDATAITIGSNEKVGIGTTSTDHQLSVNAADFDGIQLLQGGTDTGYIGVYHDGSSTGRIYVGALSTIDFQTGNGGATDGTSRVRIDGNNVFLNGGTDARIQLGSGGAGANSTSNNTVHIRGDSANLKMMAASGGELLYEQNGTERFRITSTGILRNTAGDGMVKIEVPAFISLADGSSVSIFVDTAGSCLVSVYEGGTGSGALVWLNYANSSGGNFLKSGGNSNFSSSDTDGQLCIIKSGNSHSATIKNRLGGTINLAVGVYGTKIDSAS